MAGTRAHAEALKDEVAAVLASVGLRLSEAKTSIRHIDEGVCFLGWRIQRHQQRRSQRRYVYTYPSKTALGAVKATVRTLTTTMRNQPLGVLLHRLNRGGDRQANAALDRIVVVRLRWDQPTKDYMARRLAEGKTKKEVICCLKR
jgi:hypothetical protein